MPKEKIKKKKKKLREKGEDVFEIDDDEFLKLEELKKIKRQVQRIAQNGI